jgi:hypothetical protein
VVLGAEVVRIIADREACRADPATIPASDNDVEITLPIRLKHRCGVTLIGPVDQPLQGPAQLDKALVRAVCVAREWRRRLETGEVATTRELAKREGLCHRHTGRLLPLGYLAPELIDAIVYGRQPRAMTLQALTATSLPRSWEDQRRLFARFA